MAAPLPLCPRCGGRGDGSSCATCDLDVLIPDLAELDRTSFQQAELGPDYLKVNETYMAVITGSGRVDQLFGALQQLERRLTEWQNLCSTVEEDSLAEQLATIDSHLDGALDGVEQMKRVAQSRRVADLNQGWKTIFENAVELSEALPGLARASGEDLPQLEREAAIDTEDSVVLGKEY